MQIFCNSRISSRIEGMKPTSGRGGALIMLWDRTKVGRRVGIGVRVAMDCVRAWWIVHGPCEGCNVDQHGNQIDYDLFTSLANVRYQFLVQWLTTRALNVGCGVIRTIGIVVVEITMGSQMGFSGC